MYTVTATVPFNMVLDTDMGLWKLIQSRYPDTNVFYPGMLNIRDLNIMKHVMVTRNEVNPLYSILKKEYYESANDLYDQFMDRHYEEILSLSQKTGIFDMIRRSDSVSDILRFTILCNTELERTVVLNRFQKYRVKPNVRVVKDISEFNISDFGSVYVKEFSDILNYKKVEGKNIIIGNYMFNFEKEIQDVPLEEVSIKVLPSNVLQIIDIYAFDRNKIPVG